MALKKALYYGAVGIAVLIAVSIAVSVLSTALSLAWAVVSAAVSLAVLLGVVYVAYRVGVWLFGGGGGSDERLSAGGAASTGSSESESSADPEERLRQQYVEGRLTEEEFERRLEERLQSDVTGTDDHATDVDVERELDRLKRD